MGIKNIKIENERKCTAIVRVLCWKRGMKRLKRSVSHVCVIVMCQLIVCLYTYGNEFTLLSVNFSRSKIYFIWMDIVYNKTRIFLLNAYM